MKTFVKLGEILLWGITVTVLFSCSSVWAAGFQLFNELSAKATAQGSAMSARDDVAECAWFNPAAAAILDGPKATAGMAVVFPSMELDGNGYDPEMKNMAYPVPYMYAAMPFMEQFGASIAVNSPCGLTTEWDNDWVGRYYAQYTNLTSIYITPSLSWSPAGWISFGAGAQIAYADADMRKSIPVSSLQTEVYTKLQGDDWAEGYILSVLVKPHEKWNFGLTFRSQMDFDLDGDAKYEYPVMPEPYNTMLRSALMKSDISLPLTLPQTLSLAVTTTALQNWRFSLELLWTAWSNYDNLHFQYDNMPGQGPVPGDVKYEKDWNDVWSIHTGVEYMLNDAVTLRASYVWDQSPIDDDYRDPSLPTNDRHIFGFGAGWKWRQLELDAAYSYIHLEDAGIGKRATPTLDGTYSGDAHIVNISFSWNF
jgi:long-chain fatty acid transport protein